MLPSLPRAPDQTGLVERLVYVTPGRRGQVVDVVGEGPLGEVVSDDRRDTGGAQGLSAEALTRITGLQGAQRGIVDLRGLECASNLRSLGLAGNEIADLGPLAPLTLLRELELSDNPITDLKPLAGLAQLEKLVLARSGVAALDVVAGMAGLRHLDVAGGKVEDDVVGRVTDALRAANRFLLGEHVTRGGVAGEGDAMWHELASLPLAAGGGSRAGV